MSNQHSPDQFGTLRESIRKGFFLRDDINVSDELIGLFREGTNTNNLRRFAEFTAPLHTDQFAIHITHDIDWINPHHPYSFANVVRSLAGKHQWISAQQVLNSRIFTDNLEQLLNLESESGIDAIYCIGATKGQQLGRYDIRYSITARRTLRVIEMILARHNRIGLQSSYHAFEKKSLRTEIAQLETATHQRPEFHRCHYLHASPGVMYPQLLDAGIKYELGYGHSRQVGFKNRFPGKFRPIDPLSGNIFDITIIPLILMDNTFFFTPYQEVIKRFRETLDQLKRYNGSACISFHPENMLLKPQLYNYFEEIVHICKQEGALINPPLNQP